MEITESEPAPELPAEEEMALIRDITAAAEAHAKEGDIFFLITNRSPARFLLLLLDPVSGSAVCLALCFEGRSAQGWILFLLDSLAAIVWVDGRSLRRAI